MQPVKANGVALATEVWSGERSALVCIHGLTANHACWHPIADVLAPSGYSLAIHDADLLGLLDQYTGRMEIRLPESDDLDAVMTLATEVIGPERAGPFVRSHVERHHLLVAAEEHDVLGFIAYRTDWFQCTFVSLVSVTKDHRRTGIARALYRAVESMSPSPRLFSSTEETNGISIRMHTALGFTPSGHIDNLPQGYRELLFYKRIHP